MFKKAVPVSSVLHLIALNYKQWYITYTHKHESLYSHYFVKIKNYKNPL